MFCLPSWVLYTGVGDVLFSIISSASFPKKVPGNLREREFKIKFGRHQGQSALFLLKNATGVASRDSPDWAPYAESLEGEGEVH